LGGCEDHCLPGSIACNYFGEEIKPINFLG